ncbi:hypothetical protein [Sphingomonas sp. 2R-10]|uniref:hypothetical protein n=1 Tax=Sphingomonas sp. 2R-10 TaxID=3045148 RepID=UPI0013DE7826|nr:hypothetical protein [Sphingomonas sp. 2R-10]
MASESDHEQREVANVEAQLRCCLDMPPSSGQPAVTRRECMLVLDALAGEFDSLFEHR